jgi:hypothetical protein
MPAAARLAAAALNLVRRAAATLRPPLWQEAKALIQERTSHRDSLGHSLDAGGLPVLLVGGLASSERMLSPLQDCLCRLNCRCLIASVRHGVGCGEQSASTWSWHSSGVRGLMKAGCLWGECCARFRADLRRSFPAEVPFLSVYSPQDQVVDWRSTLDPAARHRPVPTTHSGLLWSAESLSVITEEIGTLHDELLAAEPTAARTSSAA